MSAEDNYLSVFGGISLSSQPPSQPPTPDETKPFIQGSFSLNINVVIVCLVLAVIAYVIIKKKKR